MFPDVAGARPKVASLFHSGTLIQEASLECFSRLLLLAVDAHLAKDLA